MLVDSFSSSSSTTLPQIHISRKDFKAIAELLRAQRDVFGRLPETLQGLYAELDRAVMLEEAQMPPDVITLYRVARLQDLEENDIMEYQLVLPHEADVGEGRISVFAPLGMAIIGYRVGDRVEWQVPRGSIRLSILEVKEGVPPEQYASAGK